MISERHAAIIVAILTGLLAAGLAHILGPSAVLVGIAATGGYWAGWRSAREVHR